MRSINSESPESPESPPPLRPVPLEPTGDGRFAEQRPSHCPHGHRHGAGTTLVGSQLCPQIAGTGAHRTYECLTCQQLGVVATRDEAVTYWPPIAPQCTHHAFDSRRVDLDRPRQRQPRSEGLR
jgi:hypothetical protein